MVFGGRVRSRHRCTPECKHDALSWWEFLLVFFGVLAAAAFLVAAFTALFSLQGCVTVNLYSVTPVADAGATECRSWCDAGAGWIIDYPQSIDPGIYTTPTPYFMLDEGIYDYSPQYYYAVCDGGYCLKQWPNDNTPSTSY